MTPERADYLLCNGVIGGDLRMAFRRACDSSTSIIHPDGITPDEDKAIKAVWETMPGWTSYWDALLRIAAGKGKW